MLVSYTAAVPILASILTFAVLVTKLACPQIFLADFRSSILGHSTVYNLQCIAKETRSGLRQQCPKRTLAFSRNINAAFYEKSSY
jgi:hypothetical protein